MTENFTTSHQKNHRSIRFFKDQPVDPAVRDEIFQVASRTASSMGMQTASIIRLTDPKKKQAVMEVAGQAYIANAPELYIFIIDLYRHVRIAEEKNNQNCQPSLDHFLQGFADTHLMAQNMMNAIESFALGGTFLGNVLNDPQAIIDLLGLPPYTFPILGMIMGVVDDHPQLKPRLPMEKRLFENSYQTYDSYLDEIKDYDQEMTTYYDTRKKNQRSDSFSNQVLAFMSTTNPKREEILKVIQDQGFDLAFDISEK